MDRKTANTGDFAHLPIPMQIREVRRIAEKYGIDLSDVKIVIDRDVEKLKDTFPWTGGADYFSIGRINLYPKAFISEEEVGRTIVHEKAHVQQFKEYGTVYVQENKDFFEDEAQKLEDERFGERK